MQTESSPLWEICSFCLCLYPTGCAYLLLARTQAITEQHVSARLQGNIIKAVQMALEKSLCCFRRFSFKEEMGSFFVRS